MYRLFPVRPTHRPQAYGMFIRAIPNLSDQEPLAFYTRPGQEEDAFRALKSEPGPRPVDHRLNRRLEGHLFITVLAYHLVASMQRQLQEHGINHRREAIRIRLATRTRVTAALTDDQGERLCLRQATDHESFHLEVHRALGLPPEPLKTRNIKV